ncbi:MAG: hypothetical protein J6B54_01860 [Clostridia bacterium]|nr:hypothetical protein [Clostridia bacterium]
MSVTFGCGFRRIGSVDEVSAVFAEALIAGRFDEFFATVGISKDEVLSVGVILEEYAWMVLGEDLNAEDFFPGEDAVQTLQSLGLENGNRILLGAGTVPTETVPGEITAYAILLDSHQTEPEKESFFSLCLRVSGRRRLGRYYIVFPVPLTVFSGKREQINSRKETSGFAEPLVSFF